MTREFTGDNDWKVYGTTTKEECYIPMNTLEEYCKDPVLYDIFVKESANTRTPMPVRIWNAIRDTTRPNVNNGDGEDAGDDFLVYRSLME